MDELDPVFNRVAAYFALLSEPMRLKIMHAVCLEEKSVGQIVEATGATQTNVSRHLNRMHAAGAVSRRKDGNQVYYRVADETLVEMCRNVCVRIAAEIDLQQPLRRDLLELLPQVARPRPRTRRNARHA
jgi:DNA-binding transcriptional ArsR family regulator